MGTAYNVISGVGNLYIGAFGATEPADSAVNTTPAASAWTNLGFTNDGVTVNVNQDLLSKTVDQVADIIGRAMTQRDVQVVTNLAEATLENLAYVLNSGTIATGTGFKTYDPVYDGSELVPTYRAVLFDGYAPQSSALVNKKRRFILRKTLSIDNVGVPYKKDAITLYPVTWGIHYVSSVISPFHIVDET